MGNKYRRLQLFAIYYLLFNSDTHWHDASGKQITTNLKRYHVRAKKIMMQVANKFNSLLGDENLGWVGVAALNV